jgi:TRAP transporter TAXI family solute receptor
MRYFIPIGGWGPSPSERSKISERRTGEMSRQSKERRTIFSPIGKAGALALVTAMAIVLVTGTVLPAEAKERKVLRWWTAPPGGPWYAMATAIAKIVKEKTGYSLEVGGGGGVVNMYAINEGKADLAITATEVLPEAWAGEDRHGIYPFKKPLPNLRQAFLLTENFEHIAVWADSDIRGIEDLRGKRVDSKVVGFSAEAFFRLILKVHDMSYKDMKISHLGMTDGVLAMKDGHLDAYALYGPYPMGPFMELASFKPIRLLEIQKEYQEKLHSMNEAVLPGVVKAGTYRGLDKDVNTVKTELVTVCSKDLPEKQVYEIVKAYAENLDRLGTSFAAFKTRTPKIISISRGLPLHPGAEKYFKEIGAL